MKLKILSIYLLLIQIIYGQGIDGGISIFRGITPRAMGHGKLGLSLFNEYSKSNMLDSYTGEYIITSKLSLCYGLTNSIDLKLNLPYYTDVLENFRYGAGDLSIGAKFVPNFFKTSFWANSFQFMIILPTGFKENPEIESYPYIRSFSAKKLSFNLSYQTQFSYGNFDFVFNLGYCTLPQSDTGMYAEQLIYKMGDYFLGVSRDGTEGTSAPQLPFVVSLSYRIGSKIRTFVEYSGAMMRTTYADINDPVALTPGFSVKISKNLILNLGVDFDLFHTIPKTTYIVGINFRKDLFSTPIIFEESPITAENIKRIAILNFVDIPQKGIAPKLYENLINNILYTQDFQLIDDNLIQKAIEVNHIDTNALYDKNNLAIIGRNINADYIIIGKIIDDNIEYKSIKGIPHLIGNKGIVLNTKFQILIVKPELAEIFYTKTMNISSSINKGLYFLSIDKNEPDNFADINEQNLLVEKNIEDITEEILKTFYMKFYDFSEEKTIDHMLSKKIFPKN